jgi:hypothetical protein
MCHFYYTLQYKSSIIIKRCVTFIAVCNIAVPLYLRNLSHITLCNISELLYLCNVSLLLHFEIYQNYYTYAMCHFYYTVQYIRTIMCPSYYTVQYIRTVIIMQCVTSLSLCNTKNYNTYALSTTPSKISELLYLCNMSLLLHWAIYQLYSHTTRTIYYSLFT